MFGGTFGGPVWLPKFGEGGKSIWKGTNRAFFFLSYQGIRNPATDTGFSGNLAVLGSELPRLQSTFPANNLLQNYARFSPFAISFNNPAAINSTITGTPTASLQFGNARRGLPR